MAAAWLDAAPIVIVQDELDRGEIVRDAPALTNPAEDLLVLLDRWVGHFDLVSDPPQERLVDQACRVQVGGEDDELIEGYRDLLAGLEIQIVLALLQRNDPAIEEIA